MRHLPTHASTAHCAGGDVLINTSAFRDCHRPIWISIGGNLHNFSVAEARDLARQLLTASDHSVAVRHQVAA